MRNVHVQRADDRFAQDVEVGSHRLRADEPVDKGGADTGAAPHELLLAALGSCTAMTLKGYADRKGWTLRDVKVNLTGDNSPSGFAITRTITLDGELDAEQRQRLLEIADKCPVHKTLVGEITIATSLP